MKLKLIAIHLLLLTIVCGCDDKDSAEKNNKISENKINVDNKEIKKQNNNSDNNELNNSDGDYEFEEVYEECITRLRAIKEGKKSGKIANPKKQQKNNESSDNKLDSEEEENRKKEVAITSIKDEENRQNEEEKKREEENRKAELKKQEEELFEVTTKDIILGDPTSKIKIIEYSSFTCPSCSYYNSKYFPDIYNKYIKTGKIAYIVREVVNNKQDLYATLLVKCMLKHNGMENYEKIRNLLFEKQNSWAFTKNFIDILTNIAQLSGLSDDLYLKCVNDKDMNDEIIDDLKRISEYKNDSFGTPFFVVNKSPAVNRFDSLGEEIEKSILKQEK